MKIKEIQIENFRSIRSLSMFLGDTTVLIGPNNSGKTAVLEALRIALSRRWGVQGTGFTEDDVHRDDDATDAQTAPPVKIRIVLEETKEEPWPSELKAELDDFISLMPNDVARIAFEVTYSWDEDKRDFDPRWRFLDADGVPRQSRGRSMNTTGLFKYLLFFWIGALRDAEDEFGARSKQWGRLLKSVDIPDSVVDQIQTKLDDIDQQLLNSDDKLKRISEIIGKATGVAAGRSQGSAKLRMSPFDIWDLLSRASVLMRNDGEQPWFPLDHHGQGLQSLAIVFLFQAIASESLSDSEEGAEPIFAIEEPEVHLHPQAARTLWKRISELSGQKVISTHSPYFVQNTPLKDLRILRFSGTTTVLSCMQNTVCSGIKWTEAINRFVTSRGFTHLIGDSKTGFLSATSYVDKATAKVLVKALRPENIPNLQEEIESFHHNSRVLVSAQDEADIVHLNKRLRGEIFFAKYWLIIEGQSEYPILHAIAQAMDFDLDQHGVSVIDFKNNGNASIFPALADAFGIPWYMVVDGDSAGDSYKRQLSSRGFSQHDLAVKFHQLPKSRHLETHLVASANEALLWDILDQLGVASAATRDITSLHALLEKNKTGYTRILSQMIVADPSLVSRMPPEFITAIETIRDHT